MRLLLDMVIMLIDMLNIFKHCQSISLVLLPRVLFRICGSMRHEVASSTKELSTLLLEGPPGDPDPLLRSSTECPLFENRWLLAYLSYLKNICKFGVREKVKCKGALTALGPEHSKDVTQLISASFFLLDRMQVFQT